MHALLLVLGDWLRNQTEHVIMAVRGRPVVQSANLTTLLKGPFHLVRKNAHSAKPKEFYDFVEKLCPAPRYADLFSRYQHNERWNCHGDEAPPYDAAADFAGSLDDCYAAIRERIAAGGKGWEAAPAQSQERRADP